MKRVLFFMFFLFFLFSFSQNNEQKDLIKFKTNLHSLGELSKSFLKKDEIVQSKIAFFLDNHPNYKRVYYSNDVKYELFDIVNEKPIYRATDNFDEARATKTNTLQSGGELGLNLNGEGMLIGVWDGGLVRKSHLEFQDEISSLSRIMTPETNLPNPSSDNHATHVAGTITATGLQAAAKGMAPKANLLSYDWTNDMVEVVGQISVNSLLISNHSYGVPVVDNNGDLNVPVWYMGCYNSDAVDWDQVAYDAPYYLMVVSAGNNGGDSYTGGLMSGYDKLTGEKNSKNNLVVANANPTIFPTGFMNVVINGSSSQGPSDDGRIKPDIAGDGTNVYSTYNTSDSSYGNMTGTSMASPNVAGSLLLLQQHYNNLSSSYMRSATLKGLVCHTSFDPGTPGPDARFGWGLLDSKESAIALTNSFDPNPTAVVSELSLVQGGDYEIEVFVNDPKKLKATIAWTDVPGAAKDNQLNSTTPALVNDLDLRITKDLETFYPWKLQLSDVSAPAVTGDNTVDNVEKVEVDNASGFYTIHVSHKGTLVDGPQAYSLIVTGFDQVTLGTKNFTIQDLAIYPNPFNDILNISSKNETILSYEIFDMGGRVIKRSAVGNLNTFVINTADLTSGIYMLNLKSENGEFTQKIVKK